MNAKSDPAPAALPRRLVCFDLGGVLVRIASTWNEAYRFAGLDLRAPPAGVEFEAKRRDLASRLERGSISLDDWADSLSRALGVIYTAEELKRAHHAITREEHPGALELIDDLHAAGIGTACLSNTNHEHWIRLVHRDGSRALGGTPEYPAVQRIEHPFASHLLRLAKPDRAIYERFERLTGARGTEILFFDDREENAVAGRRHGWLAEWIDVRFNTIAQMRRRLRAEGWL